VKKLTIAVNTRFLLDQRLEGIGWFTYETLRRLVQWHPEHQFIFFFDRSHHPRFVFGDNVTPVVLFPPARHPFLFYAWFEWSVARALKKYQADLFISTDGFLCLNTKVPTLLVIHDIAHVHFSNQVKYLEQRYYNYFMPKFAQKAARIATVSSYSKSDIHQQYQIPNNQIDVVYNGARQDFQPLALSQQASIKNKYADGQDYFFYVGAVHPRKNVHRLITAFDQFKAATQSPLKLLIGGRWAWQTGVVQAAYEAATYKKDIKFLGYLPDEEVPLLMASAFAFTYVSNFEGFGIPILEALYCEVPVITSTASSMPEVAGEAGLLVNPNEVSSIVLAMTELFENKQLRADLSAKAQLQRQKFSWDLTTKRLDSSIHKIIKNQLKIQQCSKPTNTSKEK